MKKCINHFIFNNIHCHWNIAITDFCEDLSLHNTRWMKHNYRDRWFADPFIIDETSDTFVILAEEFMRDERKGRLARLTVNKTDCVLLNNETILNLDTHLSFPNYIKENGKIYVYPENKIAGKTTYYEYGDYLMPVNEISSLPLADAVIQKIGSYYYMLYTLGDECNGNHLIVQVSDKPFGPYKPHQEIVFSDNIARRAGQMFMFADRLISPAQICNNRYGEGVCLQEVTLNGTYLTFKEIKRLYPTSKDYPNGFHTYNMYGHHVVIDGYRFKHPLLSRIYFGLRGAGI